MTSFVYTNEVIWIRRLRRQVHPSSHLHLPQQGILRVFAPAMFTLGAMKAPSLEETSIQACNRLEQNLRGP